MTAKTKAIPAAIACGAMLALSGPAQAETACPEEDFYAFLDAFQNTPASQKDLSAAQIEMTTFQDMGGAMPARITQLQDKDDLHWPILPSLSELNRQDLRVRFYQDTPVKAELAASAMEGPEVFFSWQFEKKPCWTLVGFTDGSRQR